LHPIVGPGTAQNLLVITERGTGTPIILRLTWFTASDLRRLIAALGVAVQPMPAGSLVALAQRYRDRRLPAGLRHPAAAQAGIGLLIVTYVIALLFLVSR
jgi:hypothetical protein